MEIGEARVLRVYISSTDKFKFAPLYEVIVFAAKRYKLAGATVIKGILGYGGSSMISSSKFWEITEKLPLIVEIIDSSEKIDQFFETIRPYFNIIKNGCIITTEPVNIILYKTGVKNLK